MTIKFNGNFAQGVTNFSSSAKIMSCTQSNSKNSNRPKFFQNFIASVRKVCIFGGQIYIKCLTSYNTMKQLNLTLTEQHLLIEILNDSLKYAQLRKDLYPENTTEADMLEQMLNELLIKLYEL